jgi:acyl carrier protein
VGNYLKNKENIMENEIQNYITAQLVKKKPIPENVNIGDFNFIESGHINSLSTMKFIITLEDKFNVELTGDDIASNNFKTVNGLTNIIFNKL